MATKKQLKNFIEKLSIVQGDIIVVRDYDTMKAVMSLDPRNFDPPLPPFPVLYAPAGIDKVDVETLRKYVEEVDRQNGKSLIHLA